MTNCATDTRRSTACSGTAWDWSSGARPLRTRLAGPHHRAIAVIGVQVTAIASLNDPPVLLTGSQSGNIAMWSYDNGVVRHANAPCRLSREQVAAKRLLLAHSAPVRHVLMMCPAHLDPDISHRDVQPAALGQRGCGSRQGRVRLHHPRRT